MNDTTQTLLRSVLKMGAGYLVSKGLADQSTAEMTTAGVGALIGIAWGVLHRRKVAPAPAPASETSQPGYTRAPAGKIIPLLLFCFLLSVLCFLGSGCVVSRPHLRETINTNGVVKREMWMPTYAAWPASQTIDRQKATLGKTFSVNTSGMNEQTGGTNVVEALKTIDSIVGKIRVP